MSYIGKEPQVGNYSVLDALSASSTASYTMQLSSTNFTPESANHLIVSLNGVIQKPGSSYTVSGSTITFSSSLTSSDSIDFIIALGNVLDIGTPSDGTVTNAKLASDLISGETDIGGAIADADLFLIDDGAGGTLRKTAASRIKTYIGGDFVKLATSTTTASTSTIEFTGLDTSTYRGYMVSIQNLVFANSENLNMQVGTSSGYLTDSDYNSAVVEDNSRTDHSAANTSRGPDGMNAAFSATMWIWPAPNSDIESGQRALYFFYQGFQRSGGDRLGFTAVEDTSLAGTAFDRFKMFGSSSGNFEAGGVVTVYGVKY